MLGRTRKNYKKVEVLIQSQIQSPAECQSVLQERSEIAFFFFFEKIAQTLCQSEYSLCPQKSMSLSQKTEEKEGVKGKVKEVE